MAVSVKIISQVWEQSAHRGSALLMLLAIADYAHDDGLVWVNGITVATLAAKARVNQRQAQNLIRELDISGEIYAPVVQGRGHSTRYFVTVGFDQEHIAAKLAQHYQLTPTEAAPIAAEVAAKQATQKVQSTAPFNNEKGVRHYTIKPTEKVQSTAPFKKAKTEKVQSSVRKGAILRQENAGSDASERASSDPIRIDPYIDLSHERVGSQQPQKQPARKRTALPPKQANLDFAHEGVATWKRLANKRTLPPVLASLIANRVTDILLFEQVMTAWVQTGYNPSNVKDMLDWYDHPEKMNRKNGTGRATPADSRPPLPTAQSAISPDALTPAEVLARLTKAREANK